MISNMIESKTKQTMTEATIKLALWQNRQTDKRLTDATNIRTIGCMSRRKTVQATEELTVQRTDCVSAQSTEASDKQPVTYAGSQINGQLTALAAISIIN
jgi:hypothetical protein